MGAYLFRRVVSLVPVLLGVTTIVFFLLHVVPGDPVDLMLGETAGAAQREDLRRALHLDQPILHQYVRYVTGVVRGDLGRSIWTGDPVTERIAKHYPATIALSFAALLIALALSIPAGIFAASRKGSAVDASVMGVSLLGLSMPTFWLGPLLILLFAFRLDWFPISGREAPLSIVLPALTLGSGMAALLARMTRSTMVDVLREDFVRTARAKGLPPRQVLVKHVLRNALIPVITVLGLQAGALLAGSIVTEKIFSWPGIGLELIEAIERRDYPVVQGCVLVVAASYVAIGLLTDVAYKWIDPRVRLHHGVGK